MVSLFIGGGFGLLRLLSVGLLRGVGMSFRRYLPGGRCGVDGVRSLL